MEDLKALLAQVQEEKRKSEITLNEAVQNVHRATGAEAILLRLIAQEDAGKPEAE